MSVRWWGIAVLVGLTFGIGNGAGHAQAQTMAPQDASPVRPADGPQTAEMAHRHEKDSPSTSLTVTVDLRSEHLSVADLEKMPQKTITVSNGHTKAQGSYSGVMLSDLLARYGVTFEGAGIARVYHSYLRATGTDGYWVLYSGSEIQGAMHNADVLVAIRKDGKGLGDAGQIMLVASGDKRPARWVRNLISLSMTTVD